MKRYTTSIRPRAWELQLMKDRNVGPADVFHYGARCLREGVVPRGGCTETNLDISGTDTPPLPASSDAAIAPAASPPRGKPVDKTPLAADRAALCEQDIDPVVPVAAGCTVLSKEG